MNKAVIAERLRGVFPAEQAEVLAGVIYDAYNALVKAEDFNELKEIVRGWPRRSSRRSSAWRS